MATLLQMLHNDSVQNRFMTATSLMKPLFGSEGRTGVESYFRHFESMTYGWSDERRANLLAGHLEGAAKIAFESLRYADRQSYTLIKRAIQNCSANTTSLRARAQNEVMSGIRRRPSEGIMDYGLRVLSTIRDSFLPGTSEETVEDMAATHFLHYLGEPTIHNILILQKPEITYHQLIDKAATIHEHKTARDDFGYAEPSESQLPFDYTRPEASFQPSGVVNAGTYGDERAWFEPKSVNFTPLPQTTQPPRWRISCDNCGKRGHRSRDCWEPRHRNQPGQSQEDFQPSFNTVERQDQSEAIIQAVFGTQVAPSEPAQCPIVNESPKGRDSSHQSIAAAGLRRSQEVQAIPEECALRSEERSVQQRPTMNKASASQAKTSVHRENTTGLSSEHTSSSASERVTLPPAAKRRQFEPKIVTGAESSEARTQNVHFAESARERLIKSANKIDEVPRSCTAQEAIPGVPQEVPGLTQGRQIPQHVAQEMQKRCTQVSKVPRQHVAQEIQRRGKRVLDEPDERQTKSPEKSDRAHSASKPRPREKTASSRKGQRSFAIDNKESTRHLRGGSESNVPRPCPYHAAELDLDESAKGVT